jgi:hypothetical protein
VAIRWWDRSIDHIARNINFNRFRLNAHSPPSVESVADPDSWRFIFAKQRRDAGFFSQNRRGARVAQ